MGIHVQGRVAAGEDEAQAVIGKVHFDRIDGGMAVGICRLRLANDFRLLVAAGPVASGKIDELAVGDGGDPGGRIVGKSLDRLTGERGGEGVLYCFLG